MLFTDEEQKFHDNMDNVYKPGIKVRFSEDAHIYFHNSSSLKLVKGSILELCISKYNSKCWMFNGCDFSTLRPSYKLFVVCQNGSVTNANGQLYGYTFVSKVELVTDDQPIPAATVDLIKSCSCPIIELLAKGCTCGGK